MKAKYERPTVRDSHFWHCNKCQRQSPPVESKEPERIQEAAIAEGWKLVGGCLYCKYCLPKLDFRQQDENGELVHPKGTQNVQR